jgi:hypothetical protein
MKKKNPPKLKDDSFESVAKRLGCDSDLKALDTKLGKIAKAKPEKVRNK